jgi:hypothetical protein
LTKIRVAFLTFYYEAWDALASVHSLMLADPRFEVEVFVLPRRLTGDLHYDDASAASAFFSAAGIKHRVLSFEDSYQGLGVLRDWAPDYTFINYPWQRNYQPAFRVDELIKFTRVAYVPYYSLPLTNEPADGNGVASHLYTQRSHQLASLIFTQDEFVRAAYANTSRGNAHVHFVGSPKIDALIAAAGGAAAHSAATAIVGASGGHSITPRGERLQLVWAPHHSYSPHWLNFGVFAQMHIQMLAWARDHQELDVIMRPHPFLFGTLVDRGVLTATELAEWRQAWDELPNTSIDSESSAGQILAKADLLLTDGISFLAEYPLATGKPAVFIEKSGHWPLSPIGEIAAAANVCLRTFDEFVAGFDYLIEAGLPNRATEIAALREAAMPFGVGGSAPKIIEIVVNDFVRGAGVDENGQGLGPSPLVDPSVVTETAWERQPGREPIND